jgi:glycosyl hydrolase family 65
MTTNKYFLMFSVLFGVVYGYAEETTSKPEATYAPNRLWYKQAAGKWTETLPLGNGRLGATVYGAGQVWTHRLAALNQLPSPIQWGDRLFRLKHLLPILAKDGDNTPGR